MDVIAHHGSLRKPIFAAALCLCLGLGLGSPGTAWAQEKPAAPGSEKPEPKADADAPPAATPEGEPATREIPGLQRSGRMEFDARLIRGETPKAGAVYLFKRARRRLPLLVDQRRSYLDDMVEPVLGRSPLLKPPPVRETKPLTVVLTEEQKKARADAKAEANPAGVDGEDKAGAGKKPKARVKKKSKRKKKKSGKK